MAIQIAPVKFVPVKTVPVAAEEKLAILFADISGYTALTETHGASTAADVVDKFISLVNRSLVGSSSLHQVIGDEVMIISPSVEDVVFTVLSIIEHAGSEKYFPQLHGGLHYGNTLKRGDNYFGTTINLASRITSRASSGEFLCSEEFNTALTGFEGLFVEKGAESFKNISGSRVVYELDQRHKKSVHIDPVCRMLIHDTESAFTRLGEAGVYFCSEHCVNERDRVYN